MNRFHGPVLCSVGAGRGRGWKTRPYVFGGASVLVWMVICLAGPAACAADLKDYIDKPEESYKYVMNSKIPVADSTVYSVDLTSQTWQGIIWRHWLSIIKPKEVAHPDTALLLLYGGRNGDKPPTFNTPEALALVAMAEQTKAVVVTLSQVPNEPLFDGKTGDALIAYTYEKFLSGAGDDWPLQLPMVKSAVRAMDTIQAVAKDILGQDIQRFVLAGASKRGWTAWLTAAVDARVAGVAPMTFDMLNMAAQIEHQAKSYGTFSDKMGEYTNQRLYDRLQTPEAKRLLDIVDPYAYRDRLTMPKLMIMGTNDPYWTADSVKLYHDKLPGPKYIHYEPNAGHEVTLDVVPIVTAFFNAILTGLKLPQLEWTTRDDSTLTVTWDDPQGTAILWQAQSPNRDFRQAQWSSTPLPGTRQVQVAATPPQDAWAAYYVAVTFSMNVGDTPIEYALCTPAHVIPDTYPNDKKAVPE